MTSTAADGPGPIRVQVPLVIGMTCEQVQAYAAEYGLPFHDGPLRAKDVVDHVRENALSDVRDSAAFGAGAATVTLKGR